MMPERPTAAGAVTENSKPTTKYTYDYDRLQPLAMVGALPDVEAFSVRPAGLDTFGRALGTEDSNQHDHDQS